MPKLAVLSGRQVCAILERHGFVAIRQRGSHIVMQRLETGITTTIPIPDHDELRRGTLRVIIRQSAIGRSEFEVDG